MNNETVVTKKLDFSFCPFCGEKTKDFEDDQDEFSNSVCFYCKKQLAKIWHVKKSVAFKHKQCEHCDSVNSYLASYCSSCGNKNTLTIKYSSLMNPAYVITKDDVTGKSKAAIISLVSSIIGLALIPIPIIDWFSNLNNTFWPTYSIIMTVMLIALIFGFLGIKKSYQKGPAIIGLTFSILILFAGMCFGIVILIYISLW